MTTLPVSAIVVGERDRSDLGDVAELAASIKAVGLLHPVVVTASYELVAGGRRLAAVRSLGWTDVPVTIVTIDTVADALRAGMEENTCRKSLTLMEASRARQRRAELLAPKAAERKAQAPGAPQGAKVSPPKLGEETKRPSSDARTANRAIATAKGWTVTG